MALTCDYGPWMVAAWGDSSVITPLRADLLGCRATDAAEINNGLGRIRGCILMQTNGARNRRAYRSCSQVEVLTGYSFPADDVEYFLFGTDTDTGYPAGMLAEQDKAESPSMEWYCHYCP